MSDHDLKMLNAHRQQATADAFQRFDEETVDFALKFGTAFFIYVIVMLVG